MTEGWAGCGEKVPRRQQKMLVKSLEESEKGYNFALAFGNGGSAGDADKATRASGSARSLKKKSLKILQIQKTICNLQSFSASRKRKRPIENIERFTIDKEE